MTLVRNAARAMPGKDSCIAKADLLRIQHPGPTQRRRNATSYRQPPKCRHLITGPQTSSINQGRAVRRAIGAECAPLAKTRSAPLFRTYVSGEGEIRPIFARHPYMSLRLRNQQNLAEAPTAFKGAMRLRRLRERKGIADRYVEFSGHNPVEQVAGAPQHIGMIGNVMC